TATDYVYQLKRMVHPQLHSPIAGLMSEYILGMDEYAARLEELDRDGGGAAFLDLRPHPHPGVESVDRYTYRITLKGKYPQFIYWLAMPFFAPMPWEADRFFSQPGMVERNLSLDWYPLGTGPYMLAENNPNRRMVLARNPNFREEQYPAEGEKEDRALGLLEDAGRPIPFIEQAVYSLEKESISYWNKFLQGYYDATGISSDSFDQAVQLSAQGSSRVTELLKERGIGLLTAVTSSIYYTGFNMLDPVIGGYSDGQRKLRRAISIAMDAEEYVSIFANGRGIAAQGPLPPAIFGHLQGRGGINPYVYTWADGGARRRSLEEARMLLAEAGYPHGRDKRSGKPLVLHLDVRAVGPDDKARLDWMRKQFSKLNLQLDIRATDYNRFREKMRKGTAQIFQWGWNADYPDPENFLFLLYGPNGKVKYSGENAANYDNPEYNQLFDRMKSMDNGPRRLELIQRMLDIARRDAPWLWGYHPMDFTLQHHWYHNSKPNLMANNTLKYLRVDPVVRAERRRQWNRPVLWPLYLAGGLLLLSLLPALVLFRRRERGTG
ncbi:MAG: ABC transporter substrate-binding protein, partial [Gammaproteobacteria bacterium]|nr:ABC transporter substrate-binding protein [Gammaproteobacteria bacterium]